MPVTLDRFLERSTFFTLSLRSSFIMAKEKLYFAILTCQRLGKYQPLLAVKYYSVHIIINKMTH